MNSERSISEYLDTPEDELIQEFSEILMRYYTRDDPMWSMTVTYTVQGLADMSPLITAEMVQCVTDVIDPE